MPKWSGYRKFSYSQFQLVWNWGTIDWLTLILWRINTLALGDRNYTLERMFTRQLLEAAQDELSFRTVVRDMHTKSPLSQIVLLNPNAWCYSGCCMHDMEPAAKINMYPIVKLLFSANIKGMELEPRWLLLYSSWSFLLPFHAFLHIFICYLPSISAFMLGRGRKGEVVGVGRRLVFKLLDLTSYICSSIGFQELYYK